MMEALPGIEKISEAVIGQNALKIQEALTRKNSDLRPALQLRIPIDLTTARNATNPLKVSGPFSGFYVENASTSTGALAKLSLSSPEQGNLANYTQITKNDSAKFTEPVKDIFITNTAQSGSTLTLILYFGVEIKPGSYNADIAGGISTGSGMTPEGAVSLAAATVKEIWDASISATKVTLTNIGGDTVWISGTNGVKSGTNAVAGDTVGIPVAAGGIFEWTNSGPIYGISDAGTLLSVNYEA